MLDSPEADARSTSLTRQALQRSSARGALLPLSGAQQQL